VEHAPEAEAEGQGVTIWTPPVVSRFNELLKAHPALSYTQIAARLSKEFDIALTKNSAIGFGRRTGVPKRQPVRFRANGSYPRPVPRPVPVKPLKQHVEGKVQLWDLDSGDCHWPEGTEAPYLFCGMPVLGSLSYCRKHALVSYPALRGKV
jgi:hypothetical protein